MKIQQLDLTVRGLVATGRVRLIPTPNDSTNHVQTETETVTE